MRACVCHTNARFKITKLKLPLSAGGIGKGKKMCLKNSPSTASSVTRPSAAQILIFLEDKGLQIINSHDTAKGRHGESSANLDYKLTLRTDR